MAPNNVRGPTSALTEFLRDSGITAASVARRAATRLQNNQTQEPEAVAGPSQSPATNNATDGAESHGHEEENTGGNARRSSRLKTRTILAPSGYASDELDDSEGGEESSVPTKKRRKEQAPEKNLKGKGQKKKDGDDEYDPDDSYTALSRALYTGQGSSARPPVGNFENCAKCGKQFTVTKYTVCADPGPGFLCHQCAKESGTDPFKKPVVQRKRKAPSDKRKIQHFEERRFPTLVSICIKLITKHIDDVEALGDIGAVNMDEIAKALAKNRSLTPENAHLFYGGQNASLTLYDCTRLTVSALQTLPMLNPSLTSLRLDFCGQLDTDTFAAMSISLPHLKRLELLGPFLVRSQAWITFSKTHPRLEGFLVTQCPRFDLACVQNLTTQCQDLTELRLREMKVDDTWLQAIGALKDLKSLDLSSPETSCSEHALIQLLREIGPGLEGLDLSRHTSITDAFLEDGLSKWTGSLERLLLQACPEITDRAVGRLFNSWIGGRESGADGIDSRQDMVLDRALLDVDGPVRSWGRMARRRRPQQQRRGSQPSLKSADISPCQNVPLTTVELGRNHLLGSQSLISIMRHSGARLESLNINGWRDVTAESLQELGNYAQELRKLDVGWCRSVDDFILAGWVGIDTPVEGSDRTTKGHCLKLTEIKVWGCNHVTGKFPQRRGVVIHGIELQSSV